MLDPERNAKLYTCTNTGRACILERAVLVLRSVHQRYGAIAGNAAMGVFRDRTWRRATVKTVTPNFPIVRSSDTATGRFSYIPSSSIVGWHGVRQHNDEARVFSHGP